MGRVHERAPLAKLGGLNAAATATAVVVGLQSHSQVTLSNLRGIGVYCVDYHLYVCRLSTSQSPREISRNDDEEVQVQALECVYGVLRAYESIRHLEIHILGQRIDEALAFGCHALIHHAQTQVANPRVQGKSEDDQHDCRRKHQLNQQDAIASELLDFLHRQSEISSYEGSHRSLLSLELHLAHLNHIQSEEGERQYQQRNHQAKRGSPSRIAQNGVANNLNVVRRRQKARYPTNLSRYIRHGKQVPRKQQRKQKRTHLHSLNRRALVPCGVAHHHSEIHSRQKI